MPTMVERKCACCKAPIRVRAADVARGWGKFCSKSCKAIVQERKNGQHKAYLSGRGVSNLHPKRLGLYDGDDTHPFSTDGLGQFGDW